MRKWEFHGFLRVFHFRSKSKIGFYCLLLLLPPPSIDTAFIFYPAIVPQRSCKKIRENPLLSFALWIGLEYCLLYQTDWVRLHFYPPLVLLFTREDLYTFCFCLEGGKKWIELDFVWCSCSSSASQDIRSDQKIKTQFCIFSSRDQVHFQFRSHIYIE